MILLGFVCAARAHGLEDISQEPDEVVVCGDIEPGSTWTLAGSPYHVTCNAEVVAGTVLTVDPGVSVTFDSGTQLVIRGSLQAAGLADQPITFTSAQPVPAPGDWARLWFADEHGTSLLKHVVVEYSGLYGGGAIQVDGGWLTVRDSKIRYNEAAGIVASVMPTLTDNFLNNNGGTAIRLMLQSGLTHPGTLSGNGGSGNGVNGIHVWGVIDDDQTLGANDGLAYYTDGELRVGAGHTMTLEAGVVFKLDEGVITVDGTLEALGELGNEVVFTSLNDDNWGGDTNGDGEALLPAPGDWWFISLGQGAHLDLDHTAVFYGGMGDTSAVGAEGADLTITNSRIQHSLKNGMSVDDSSLVVTGSQVSHNGNNGIHFCSCTRPTSPVISGNVFEGNGEFAVFLRSEELTYVSPIIESNTGSGNGVNGIGLQAVLGSTVLKANPGLPYVVQSLDTVAESELTIEAGTIFKADRALSGTGSKIVIEGLLHIEGEEVNPVVFTSLKDDTYGGDTNGDGNATQPAPGDWRGISVTGLIQRRPPYHTIYLPLAVRRATGSGLLSGSVEPLHAVADSSSATTSDQTTAVLSHVIVRYAGYDTANLELFGGLVEVDHSYIGESATRGIYAEDTQLRLEDSTIASNGTTGLFLWGDKTSAALFLVDNVFADNGTFASYLIFGGGCNPSTEMHGNTGSGNGQVNGIYIEGFVNSGEVCRWGPNSNLPYVVWSISITENGQLELDPGVAVKFVGPALERGTGTSIITGTLEAIGTDGAPIVFTSFWDDSVGGDTDGTSFPAAPGDWLGLIVPKDGQVTFDHAIVRYGGALGANLSVTDAQLQLTNSEISLSASKGLGLNILVDGAARPLMVANTTFIDNADYAASLLSGAPTPISFEFEGNEGSGNVVSGILLDAVLDSMTLRANPTLPYVIQSVTVPSGRTVLVDPGVVFKGDEAYSGGGSLFAVEGVLQVEGTEGNPVFFTSLYDDTVGGDTLGDGAMTQPGPGDWLGLSVSAGGQANLDHTVIRYSGSGGSNVLIADAGLQMTNSEVAHSAGKGLQVLASSSGSSVVVRDSSFVDNADLAAVVRYDASVLASFEFADNTGAENGLNGILLDATLGTMAMKENPGLPYVVQSLTVAENKTVTVEPGVVFKAEEAYSGGGSLFAVEGILHVGGTAANPVYYTSLHDDEVGGDTLGDGGATQPGPGDWKGISVIAGGQVNLNYGMVRYAGSGTAALVNDGGTMAVAHSHITDNLNSGISNLPDSDLTVTHSVISHSGGRGVANGGLAIITYCDIMDNAGYGVYSWTDTMISAQNNYWGSADGPSWDGVNCPSPPHGSGDLVSCHSVDYEPFATMPYH
jgi:hypothetical protein